MATQPAFDMHVIEAGLTDGYWIQAVDVDGDGRPDIFTSGLNDGHVRGTGTPTGASTRSTSSRGPCRSTRVTSRGQVGAISWSATTTRGRCSRRRRRTGRSLGCENPGEAGGDWTAHPVGQLGSTHRLRLGHFTDPMAQLLALPVVGQSPGWTRLTRPSR